MTICSSVVTSCRQRAASRSLICLLVLLIVVSGGCTSAEPTLSGFGLGQRRAVRIGDVVELRLPLAETGQRQWRVTSYDSRYLAIAEAPRVEQRSNGPPEMVFTARAKVQGETVVELTETSGGGRVVRFTVAIYE